VKGGFAAYGVAISPQPLAGLQDLGGSLNADEDNTESKLWRWMVMKNKENGEFPFKRGVYC
jgi:hypothetical protein